MTYQLTKKELEDMFEHLYKTENKISKLKALDKIQKVLCQR